VAGRSSYYAYRAGAEVARLVPGPIGAPMARGISQLVGLGFMGARTRQVQRNLARVHATSVLPGARSREVASTFESYGRYFYELFRLPGATPEYLDRQVDEEGFHHIRDALRAGKGVVLALPHLGNWDFAGAWLAGVQGVTTTVVAEPLEPPELFDWFVSTRAELGMRVIPLSPSAGSEVLHALRANDAVCLLCDRDLTGDGVDVEFFGEHTTMPGGPALMALRSGAPLIPVGCYFLEQGRHRLQIGPPLDTARAAGIRADVSRITQDLAHRFEALIRAAPTDWHLMQPNWPSDRDRDRDQS
jgi:lauroyl/myristoyl acyltransferase